MKKVLVIGGSGFIGRNIVTSLLNRGDCYVTSADIKSCSIFEDIKIDKNLSKRFEEIIADFSKKDSFDLLGDTNFDEVYLLAAIVGVNKTLINPNLVIHTNTLITMNTLDWIKSKPIKRLLFASSSENYAGTSDLFDIDIPTNERVPLCISDINHPRWTYAITKMHGESAFLHSAKSLDYDCTIVRYQNIIGPDMGFGHAIPHIVERFCKRSHDIIKIYGHDQTRAFCYIDDAVSGTIKAMENPNGIGQIYHIGNDEEINMSKLTIFIGDIFKYKGIYENAPTYPGSVERRCPDITKAQSELNYAPKFSWEISVQKTVEWYKNFFDAGNVPPSGGFESPEEIKLRIDDKIN